MEKYIVVSPGRSASNSLKAHIENSLDKLGTPRIVENLEMPMIWPEIQEQPEQWTVVICTRKDMLAQVLSFYTIMLTKQTHKFKDIALEPFVIPRTYFFTFAHGILFFHERIFNIKEWPKFKNIHWLIYEDIITDWHGTGQILGFDDWASDSDKHYIGYGPVWDKVINKKEVLDWVQELQINYRFTTEKEKYKL